MNRQFAVAAACLVLTSCAAAGGAPKTSETPRRDLAGRPSIAPGGGPATTSGSASPNGSGVESPGPSTPSSSTSTSGTGHGTSPSTSSSAKPFRDFVALTDPGNDAGLDAPAYVDLRAVAVADNGTSLRVTVVVNGAVPRTAEAADTIGIGVDLYRPGTGRESEYQLFADGEPDGWFAYLDTPRGFVRYPGSFSVGGHQLVFTVPLSAVGNPRTGRVSAFADWSRRASGVTGNKSSNDYAPTIGTTSYSR